MCIHVPSHVCTRQAANHLDKGLLYLAGQKLSSSLHWSLLPESHAKELAPHVHPELDQKSLTAYCFRAYPFPGKRMTFDGNPVVLPELKPDEDWIGSDRLTPEVSLGAVT